MNRLIPLSFILLVTILLLPLGCGKKPGLFPPDYSIAPTSTPTPGGPCGYPTGWFFDSSMEGWTVAWTEDKQAPTPTPTCGVAYPGVCFPVTVTYDPAVGMPASGSLSVSMGFTRAGQQAHFSRLLSTPINMAASNLCVRLYLDSGAPVTAKIFIKTGGTYQWGNGSDSVLAQGTWVQASMSAANPNWPGPTDPSYPSYIPSDVREVGVAFTASAAGAAVVHIDSWSYSVPPTFTPTPTRTATSTNTPDPFATPTLTPTVTHTPTTNPNSMNFDAGLGTWSVDWTEAKAPASPCAMGVPYCFPVTLSFDGSTGFPTAGSASVTLLYNATVQEAHLQSNVADLNLTGRTIQARVRLDSGSAKAKLFLKTGSTWAWGAGADVTLTTGTWTTITMNASSPDNTAGAYDPVQVKAAGIVFSTGSSAVTSNVHFDTWTY